MCITTPAADAMTAQQLAEKLKAGGQAIGEITVFDETTDPNHQLGRPGQYSAKVGFVDTRVNLADAVDTPGDISRGGGIKVRPNRAAARKRADYIRKITAALGMPTMREYDCVRGGYLLRITQTLTPARTRRTKPP
ncbi:hypothetical protein [Embleya hyalina]|uniref:Uncharacterized protein n=1 Tax=Embleya hyalina TaxID=516124 RepID=A0A401Z0W1_9ACTN|nr:hypothetical protein [Embleya hyalina]GCE00472.1 hypothetical protein EHYA_08197 [Embleya hyalina]